MYRYAHQQYYFDQFPMTATMLNQPEIYVVKLLIDFAVNLYAEAFSNCQMHPGIKVFRCLGTVKGRQINYLFYFTSSIWFIELFWR